MATLFWSAQRGFRWVKFDAVRMANRDDPKSDCASVRGDTNAPANTATSSDFRQNGYEDDIPVRQQRRMTRINSLLTEKMSKARSQHGT